MSDYIDRQAAIDAVMILPQKWDGMFIQDLNCRLRDALNALPSAEVEPAKHGKWERKSIGGWHCSECGEQAPFWCFATTQNLADYCPSCGAKMEAEEADG